MLSLKSQFHISQIERMLFKMKAEGKITSWNDAKGFGFITPGSGGARVFVHINAIRSPHRRPQLHQTVFYTLSKDKEGRPCAGNVSYTERGSGGIKGSSVAFIFTGLFFAVLGVLTFITRMVPRFVIALYAVVSIITFLFYAEDKASARKDRRRTPEDVLHALALFGGWPGALIAQQTLHHKSRKASFQRVYIFTVVLNIAVTVWLLTPRGPELTAALLGKIFSNNGVPPQRIC